jgi:Ca2+-binding RTX toxin-like protein
LAHARTRDVERTFGDHQLFIGDRSPDRYEGGATEDWLFGRAGPDRLTGGEGDDDLLGGDGGDRLDGGGGMDHLDGGRGDDRLFGGSDNDGLRGGDGNDRLDEGDGHGDLEGGRGDDRLTGGRGADAFVVDPNSGHDVIYDFVAGPGMFDHLALRDIEPEELVFEQTGRGARISWNDGAASVLLVGVDLGDLAQDDFMFTDDKELIPVGRDPGEADRLVRSRAERPEREAVQDTALGTDGRTFRFDEFLVRAGTDGADAFGGTAARDYYLGLGGDDALSGGAEDDDLWGDAGDDVLTGGDGMDHLKGGLGDDELDGGAMADNLMGEDGADLIRAGAGHDMIEGGRGNDTLDGGDGADAFVVRRDSGDDVVIGGFTPGPGAFDHVAFIDILPEEVTVQDTDRGALVSWGAGSILLEGVRKQDMAQDDFMFSSVEGGGFVDDPAITFEGSRLIFPDLSGGAAAAAASDYWLT